MIFLYCYADNTIATNTMPIHKYHHYYRNHSVCSYYYHLYSNYI
jgi:hypothetical protein